MTCKIAENDYIKSISGENPDIKQVGTKWKSWC
jgi:hypothetical protein